MWRSLENPQPYSGALMGAVGLEGEAEGDCPWLSYREKYVCECICMACALGELFDKEEFYLDFFWGKEPF